MRDARRPVQESETESAATCWSGHSSHAGPPCVTCLHCCPWLPWYTGSNTLHCCPGTPHWSNTLGQHTGSNTLHCSPWLPNTLHCSPWLPWVSTLGQHPGVVQDTEAAVEELRRCVTELGLDGEKALCLLAAAKNAVCAKESKLDRTSMHTTQKLAIPPI